MKKIKGNQKKSMAIIFLAILCFISAILGVLFALNHIFSKAQHEQKWKEYDECGIF